jgi:hypothetical protein
MKEAIGKRFCSCIKKVRKTIKARDKSTKEQGAIAVCVKSVLQTKKKTLFKFSCKNGPKVKTQPHPIKRSKAVTRKSVK